ncbi:hypothetical protein C7999DRAFT_35544 [Corynascus novoguineensis]|uniref:Uncharacterized protein n=1 Tax=Corynascus novoguineensis TaxID=1126955 RepID=A0AAN7CM07_9PEZI|nr:hypothetical protein C7999DRAFT_35544 [Corynascus novoguineensis]
MGSLEPLTTAVAPVRLILPIALQIDADEPCVLEVHFPITLPHRLGPSVPAPPYHNRDGGLPAEIVRGFYGTPLAQELAAEIVSYLFGPGYRGAILPITRAVCTNPAGPEPGPYDFQLAPAWDCNAVTDGVSFDLEGGYWKDMHGEEGHGPIHAFMQALDFDWIEIYHAFKYYPVRGVKEPDRLMVINPRALRFGIVLVEKEEEKEEEGGREEEGAGDCV